MVILPQLDPKSDVPLYRQLFAIIKEQIESGKISRGEKLPATRELAGQLGLNRTTVSAAYELLEDHALIKGHVGRGSYVDGGPRTARLDWDRLMRPSGSPAAPVVAGGPEMISFATSRPSEELFPLEEFRATCAEVTAGPAAASILQLGSPNGYPPLRHYLLEQAREAGGAGPDDDILITNGCQQALDLLQRVLVRPGDPIFVEDPVYPGLRTLFSAAEASLTGIPVGPVGLDVDHLGRAFGADRPKMLLLTPNFQNPTGATIPLEARKAVLQLARDAGTIVVENDIYGHLRYTGEPVDTLKKLDDSGCVVLLGSFSKIAFPGLRVGWIVGPRPLIARLAEAKQWCDLHTDQLSQAVLLRFAESGRLEAHRKRILEAGAERLAAVIAACERELPKGTHFTRPRGGMNLWVRLPEPLDAGELLARAQRENVAYLPGRYFAVARHEPSTLRLSFAGLAPEKIRAGMAILGEIFSTELERIRALKQTGAAPAMV